eukprot:4809219-Amphidinium_carterae.1
MLGTSCLGNARVCSYVEFSPKVHRYDLSFVAAVAKREKVSAPAKCKLQLRPTLKKLLASEVQNERALHTEDV